MMRMTQAMEQHGHGRHPPNDPQFEAMFARQGYVAPGLMPGQFDPLDAAAEGGWAKAGPLTHSRMHCMHAHAAMQACRFPP